MGEIYPACVDTCLSVDCRRLIMLCSYIKWLKALFWREKWMTKLHVTSWTRSRLFLQYNGFLMALCNLLLLFDDSLKGWANRGPRVGVILCLFIYLQHWITLSLSLQVLQGAFLKLHIDGQHSTTKCDDTVQRWLPVTLLAHPAVNQ